MNINISLLTDLITKDFSGNYKKFASALKINSVTAYRVLTGRSKPGEKFISNFMLYCKNNNHSFGDYFF